VGDAAFPAIINFAESRFARCTGAQTLRRGCVCHGARKRFNNLYTIDGGGESSSGKAGAFSGGIQAMGGVGATGVEGVISAT